MSENEFQSGDRVIITPMYATKKTEDRLFEVVNKIKVNYRIRPIDGLGPAMTAPPAALTRAPKELLAKPIEAVTPLPIGSTVRVRARNIDPKTLFVVLSSGNKVKITELGGADEDRWRNVPREVLEKVTIDLVAATASAEPAEA